MFDDMFEHIRDRIPADNAHIAIIDGVDFICTLPVFGGDFECAKVLLGIARDGDFIVFYCGTDNRHGRSPYKLKNLCCDKQR